MNPEICAYHLLCMLEEDQRIRIDPELANDSRRWESQHRVHARRLKFIIKELGGWPTPSKVGAEAARAALLIIRHADKDIPFQRECLELISGHLDEISERELAFLYDRILVNEGSPQFFGTQFTESGYGAYGPRPILLIETIDERRHEIGLEPLASYKYELMQKYGMTLQAWR